jgi:hypothetical protein
MTTTQHRAARVLVVLDRARAVVATIAAGAGPATSPTARALLTSSGRLLQLLEIAHHAQHDPTR